MQKWLLKSQADDKADDNCCDWQFKGEDAGGNEDVVDDTIVVETDCDGWHMMTLLLIKILGIIMIVITLAMLCLTNHGNDDVVVDVDDDDDDDMHDMHDTRFANDTCDRIVIMTFDY